VLLGLSLRTTEIVGEVADRLASNRDGFLTCKYVPSVPDDQAIGHRQIQVIPAAGAEAAAIERDYGHRSSISLCGVSRGEDWRTLSLWVLSMANRGAHPPMPSPSD
jgi:hypothetical protein